MGVGGPRSTLPRVEAESASKEKVLRKVIVVGIAESSVVPPEARRGSWERKSA